MFAIKVGTDDTIERLEFDYFDHADTLKFLQAQVGGYVEHIALPFVNLDAWGYDEAAIVAEPQVNDLATLALHQFGFAEEFFYGPLVFTGGADADGNTLWLPAEQADDLVGFLENVKAALPPKE